MLLQTRQAPLRRAHQIMHRRVGRAHLCEYLFGRHAAVHQPDPARLAVLPLDAIEKSTQRRLVGRVAGQHFVGQRQTFGRHHQGNDDLHTIRPVIARIAEAALVALRKWRIGLERQYGKARRVWLMDRGVPTEEVLAEMRAADPPVHYLVGTPKGRLTRLEKHLVAQPWQEARPGVQVKLLAQQGELYVLAQSRDRVAKERAIRRGQLKRLWARLKQLSTMEISREELLMKLGAARDQSRSAWRLVVIKVAADSATFSYRLNRNKLRQARSREGRYLLRTNLIEEDPAKLWSHYLLLVAVEEAFKNLKGDLAIRPVFHQLEARVEAHVFIAFLAYCLHVTLARRLHALAPGLTPRSVLEKFAAVQMIDVHLPTTDGRELVLTRYTEPELSLLLKKLKLELPAQPPPK